MEARISGSHVFDDGDDAFLTGKFRGVGGNQPRAQFSRLYMKSNFEVAKRTLFVELVDISMHVSHRSENITIEENNLI
jgi:hypothetical protein